MVDVILSLLTHRMNGSTFLLSIVNHVFKSSILTLIDHRGELFALKSCRVELFEVAFIGVYKLIYFRFREQDVIWCDTDLNSPPPAGIWGMAAWWVRRPVFGKPKSAICTLPLVKVEIPSAGLRWRREDWALNSRSRSAPDAFNSRLPPVP